MNTVKIYDNEMIDGYEMDLNQFGDTVHTFSCNAKICDNTDLIMFLTEEYLESGDFNYSDDYQFNGYYLTGSDLIDLCKAYGI